MGILDNLKKTLDDKRKEVEKEVKRNIASYKDLALQTVDEAKESIIASAKEKLGEMGQENALIGKLKDMIGTSQNKRTAEAPASTEFPPRPSRNHLNESATDCSAPYPSPTSAYPENPK